MNPINLTKKMPQELIVTAYSCDIGNDDIRAAETVFEAVGQLQDEGQLDCYDAETEAIVALYEFKGFAKITINKPVMTPCKAKKAKGPAKKKAKKSKNH